MELAKAQAICSRLMRKHGLTEQGWTFRWSNAKREIGSAQVRTIKDPKTRKKSERRTIVLSRPLVQLNDEEQIRDTILHEIAHALAGVEHGHDHVWKAVCKKIGAIPKRIAGEEVNTVDARYQLICRCCQQVLAHRHRQIDSKRIKRSYCNHCGRKSLGKLRVHDTSEAVET